MAGFIFMILVIGGIAAWHWLIGPAYYRQRAELGEQRENARRERIQKDARSWRDGWDL